MQGRMTGSNWLNCDSAGDSVRVQSPLMFSPIVHCPSSIITILFIASCTLSSPSKVEQSLHSKLYFSTKCFGGKSEKQLAPGIWLATRPCFHYLSSQRLVMSHKFKELALSEIICTARCSILQPTRITSHPIHL